MISRRDLFATALVGLSRKDPNITGSFVNDSHELGHKLRDRKLTSRPKQTTRTQVVIIGGGIAGLSAAWRLDKKGFGDFVLLEMEPQPGGNSRYGQNEISRYPWAAHYVPVPGPRLTLVRELMADLGVLQDGKWEERYLCFSPQERVFIHGRWREGFEPDTREERAEWDRFTARMAELGGSGEFSIPIPDRARSAHLDSVSMQEWLEQNGFRSPYLRWYVDYACRDDYGVHSSHTSAWMGIHYFASREHEERGPLTWPEGNGWIVRRLLERLDRYVHTNSPVVQIRRKGTRVEVYTPDTLYEARSVIFAAPTFLASRLLEGAPKLNTVYSPWVTANLTLSRMPRERGFERAWDNVIYGSPSLGYVDATHMSLRTRREQAVWTWYHALADPNAWATRGALLQSSWTDWKEFILDDLARAHPDIRDCVTRIDVMRLGHAMARPLPGSIFDPARIRLARTGLGGNIVFANSDLSGYSIFEEAQARGVQAADRSLRYG